MNINAISEALVKRRELKFGGRSVPVCSRADAAWAAVMIESSFAALGPAKRRAWMEFWDGAEVPVRSDPAAEGVQIESDGTVIVAPGLLDQGPAAITAAFRAALAGPVPERDELEIPPALRNYKRDNGSDFPVPAALRDYGKSK